MDSTSSTTNEVPVRPAATVVLVRDTFRGLEVFLLQRVPGMVFAPGVAVFPGGAVDAGDREPPPLWIGPDPDLFAAALGIGDALPVIQAAMRELFEETGIALVSRPGERPRPSLLGPTARADLAAHRITWAGALAAAGLQGRPDLLRPWARLTTPPGPPRRYDTSFFLARMPVGQVADWETTEAEAGTWMRPEDALAAATQKQLQLMPPTRLILRTLVDVRDTAQLFEMPLPLLPDAAPFTVPFPSPESTVIQQTTLAASRLAPNPGPMTLDGTNSYVLSAPGSASVVVVDPGPLDADHLADLAARPVELILITHRHHDHTEAAPALHAHTGAPVRAFDPEFCIGGEPLTDGEQFAAAGVQIRVVATPGHTSDSVCFVLPDDEPLGGPNGAAGAGSVLTGDTILGRGTTVIAPPDGGLADYLASLDILIALGPATVLPAHGPVLPDLTVVATEYAAHRRQRLDQIRAALEQLGPDADAESVADLVYADVDASVRRAAAWSVAAQLEYLRADSSRSAS